MEVTNNPLHIGDGVYVSWDGYHLLLTANVPTTDRIALDPHVRDTLLSILRQVDEPIEPLGTWGNSFPEDYDNHPGGK